MNTAMPWAVEVMNTEASTEIAAMIAVAPARARPGHDDVVGRPVAGERGDREGDRVDDEHVDARGKGCTGVARDEHRASAQRSHDERLQQSGLGVAANHADGQERRQHRTEKQRREHRQAKHGRARDRSLVGEIGGGRREPLRLLEGEMGAEPVEREKDDGEHRDDRKDAPAQALGEGEAGDGDNRVEACRRARHPPSSPTASR